MQGQEVFWLDEIGREHNDLVGKKCANLGELARLRMPIPNGFAISLKAEERFLNVTGALREIQELLTEVGELKDINLQAEVSAKIRHIVESKEIPTDLCDAIRTHYEELCHKRGREVAVSVRSTGAKSHPGQYETYLNVRGDQRVLEMVKKVWASIFNARTIANLVQVGLPVAQSPAIGVGVVEMVYARSAGVCFTIHPVTGDPLKAVIEANWGLGESVVSGKVNTDMYVVDKERLKVIERNLGGKNMQIVAKEEGVVEEETPTEKQSAFVLNDDEAVEIVKLGKALELHFREPQDIEWAIDDEHPFPNNVFLLQTRPVVGVKVQKPKTTEEKLLDDLVKYFR